MAQTYQYQLLPELAANEYSVLKADIAEHGILVPVEVDEHGTLLDGHHRVRAWTELTAEGAKVADYPRIIRAGMTEHQKRAHVRRINLVRRHLTGVQRRALIEDQVRDTPEHSDRRIGSALGVDHKTVASVRDEMESGGEIPHQDQRVGTDGVAQAARKSTTMARDKKEEKKALKNLGLLDAGDAPIEQMMTATDVQRLVKEQERAAKHHREVAGVEAENRTPASDRLTLLHGDLLTAGAAIPDHSVDVVVCDPPYGVEAVPLYGALGELAARVVKPGGSVLVMTGQYTLPETVAELSAWLSYHWTIAYLTPGGQSAQIWPRKVNTFWKPVLWYTNGPYAGEWHGDATRSDTNDNDKRFHHWGQSESGMARLVEGFSAPGDVILDPFVGGGTTAVVALSLGRRCIGIDIDEAALATTRSRVAEAVADVG